jgi:hypothetical protein
MTRLFRNAKAIVAAGFLISTRPMRSCSSTPTMATRQQNRLRSSETIQARTINATSPKALLACSICTPSMAERTSVFRRDMNHAR